MLRNRLKVILAEMDKTNVWLAREAGLHPQTITSYIKGRKRPELDNALAIAKALGKRIEDIWWIE